MRSAADQQLKHPILAQVLSNKTFLSLSYINAVTLRSASHTGTEPNQRGPRRCGADSAVSPFVLL